jgi:hypothetical protein
MHRRWADGAIPRSTIRTQVIPTPDVVEGPYMYWFSRVFRHHVGAKKSRRSQPGELSCCMTDAELAEVYLTIPAGLNPTVAGADMPAATPLLVNPTCGQQSPK